MFEIKDLHVEYGAIKAVNGISLTVNEGEIVALIGANGAGKTTTLQAISGLQRASSGTIKFGGKELRGMAPDKIVKEGIAHVPQGRRVFPNLPVEDNLRLGASLQKDKAALASNFEKVYEFFPRLKERRKQKAGTLSGGEQQMLAVGRAIMTPGKMMLLDEPSMGLAPLMVAEIFRILRQINKEGTTMLLIEQNANIALKTASRAYVMETGNIQMEGESSSLANNEMIKKAYLGS